MSALRSQHGWTNGLASADSANRSVVPLNAVACGIGLVLWTKPNSAEMRMVSPEFLQYLVSGYASWYAKRHRRPGHLTQGRFKAALVQDERYFWTVSRYVHLNPVRGKRPLAAHPADWPWSSYPGVLGVWGPRGQTDLEFFPRGPRGQTDLRCSGSERFRICSKRLRGVKPCFRFTVGLTLAKLRAWLGPCGSNFPARSTT